MLDIQATGISKLIVCKGKGQLIAYRPNFIIFPISMYYGVTNDETCVLIRFLNVVMRILNTPINIFKQ